MQATMGTQPSAIVQLSIPLHPAQTIVDSNGQQFYMVPAYSAPTAFPPIMSSTNVHVTCPTFWMDVWVDGWAGTNFKDK